MDDHAIKHLRGIDRTLRACAIGAVLLLAVWVLRDILLLGFAAVLLACILRGAGEIVRGNSRLSSGASLAVVVTTALAVIGLLLWWRGAVIADYTVQLTTELSDQVQQLWETLNASEWGSFLAKQVRSGAESLRSGLSGYFPGVAMSVLGIGGTTIVVIATAAFLATSPQMYLTGALRLLPVDWRPRGREVAQKIAHTLQLWFVGQLIDMVIVGVLIGIGLWLLGVPLALTLALFAGLLNFVPYVGALAGAVPAILVALSQSPSMALWVALLFVGVQMLEGNVVAPLIQKRTIALPPALTILCQTVLGTLFGVFGLVIATPMIAAMLTAVRLIYIEDVLERDEP